MRKHKNQSYLKYAGLASQMIATLGVAIFLGHKIDQALSWRFPFFLVVLALLALGSTLWKIYNDLS